mgnify:CR=1 FL=1
MAEHVDGKWCYDLHCSKCYASSTWHNSRIAAIEAQNTALLEDVLRLGNELQKADKEKAAGKFHPWKAALEGAIEKLNAQLLAAEHEKAQAVLDMEEFRDTVLNQRGLLAENGMTSEQVNDVLGEFDNIRARDKP